MKNTNATNRGRIVGVTRSSGDWLFIVQAFSTTRKSDPILCEFARADELKGPGRKKADRLLAYLNKKLLFAAQVSP